MESTKSSLPPEAYQELKPGQTYTPFVPADAGVPEVGVRSVVWGLVMALFFAFSLAYLGLKVATVPEAAIPIAILAVGVGYAYRRRNSILENVIIQSIGSTTTGVVAGAIFTIPALFILGIPTSIFKIFLSCFFGGLPGDLFPHPAPPLFLPRTARKAALPRGHGHDRDPRLGRIGRSTGPDPHPGHRREHGLRFPGDRRPGLERSHHVPLPAGPGQARPEDQDGPQGGRASPLFSVWAMSSDSATTP